VNPEWRYEIEVDAVAVGQVKPAMRLVRDRLCYAR